MIPESSPSPAVSGAEDETFHASYRRGRFLVLALVVMTTGMNLAYTLQGYFTGGTPSRLADLLFGWACVGFICWCVFRGGYFASGCLIVMCAPFLPVLAMLIVSIIMNVGVPGAHFSVSINQFKNVGADWKSTVRFLPYGVASAYTFWVLLISKDARRYMNVRRRKVSDADPSAFEWKQERDAP